MFGSEAREIVPRHEEESAPRVRVAEQSGAVVGSDGILQNAIMRAAQCAPAYVQNYPGSSQCGPASMECPGFRITRLSKNTTANSAVIDLTYKFNRPFKLAKLTIPSAQADATTLTSIKVAGEEILRDGSINGGPFSSGNEESGGEIEGPWLEAGLDLTIAGSFAAAPAAAQAFTVAGVVKV